MTEEDFAVQLANQIMEDACFDETLIEHIDVDGPHVYIRMGSAMGEDAGVQFTLLVIREDAKN